MKNNLRTKIISTSVIVILVVIDQIIKFAVYDYLRPQGSKMLVPGFIQLRYLENDGAMMGMMSGKTPLMTALAIVCMVAVLFVIYSGWLTSKIDYASIVLIAAGGFGNIIDRVSLKYVVDFLDFRVWPVFNIADICVCVGCGLLIIYAFVIEPKLHKEK